MDVGRRRQRLVEAGLEVGVPVLQVGAAGPVTGQGSGPLDAPERVVAHPELAGPALVDEAGEGVHGFGQGDGAVLDMGPEHIDVVGAQAAQAALERRPDRLLREPLGGLEAAAGDGGPGPGLGADGDPVACAPVREPRADDELALVAGAAVDPERVVVGRVEDGAAQFGEAVQDPERRLLVGARPEAQRAEDDGALPNGHVVGPWNGKPNGPSRVYPPFRERYRPIMASGVSDVTECQAGGRFRVAVNL